MDKRSGMNWKNFNAQNISPSESFEVFCGQLFYRYCYRIYPDLRKFRWVNGKGGDGGVEAYCQPEDGGVIALQCKWFRDDFKDVQIGELRKSIKMALSIRPDISEYIVCIPRTLTSITFVRGKVGEEKRKGENSEDQLVDKFTAEVKGLYPKLSLTWWFEENIWEQLSHFDNEPLHKFWFGKEVIGLAHLRELFDLQLHGWLFERYVPKLHTQGVIHAELSKTLNDKTYRDGLVKAIGEYAILLQRAILCIRNLISQKNFKPSESETLEKNAEQLGLNYKMCQLLADKVNNGEEDFQKTDFVFHKIDGLTKLLSSDGILHSDALFQNLLSIIAQIRDSDFEDQLANAMSILKFAGMFVLGGPGTGKTHGLAHAVQQHLQNDLPALIIQAQGAKLESWNSILADALHLPSWSTVEILTALEAEAIRSDLKRAEGLVSFGGTLDMEPTKALICIDGLEEDVQNWQQWYKRIRESVQLNKMFPKIKFFFSSRANFRDESDLPSSLPINFVNLPEDGDVPLQKLAREYFKKENYDISITSFTLVRTIDSLFALRLFCDAYKGQRLTEADQIVTAGKDLLIKKLDRLNKEFRSRFTGHTVVARQPVSEALSVLVDYFYSFQEIEHGKLVELISPDVGSYLSGADIDELIDYMSSNGILIKSETYVEKNEVPLIQTSYLITYRSIVDILIANRTISKILSGEISSIANGLLSNGKRLNNENKFPNHGKSKIEDRSTIQLIVNTLFHEHGRMIGEDDFLCGGFDAQEIYLMQLHALRRAPGELVEKYKPIIDQMFYGTPEQRYMIMRDQILPSSGSSENNFGARYLHEILASQKNAFTRDKLWTGQDRFDEGNSQVDYSMENLYWSPRRTLVLSEYASYDETPLAYIWSLTSLDQVFRERMRRVLTLWALSQPSEYCKLLELVFHCGDPQMQEDMASICLSLAGRLMDKTEILNLAEWAIVNIFARLSIYRNVIVRSGFRAIVERAFQFGDISKEQIEMARPKKMARLALLPLDRAYLTNPREQFYPIMGDLAWYVIAKAFKGFLKYPNATGKSVVSQDNNYAKKLLKQYSTKYKKGKIFADAWTKAAAIAYIKSLGFDRKNGNTGTQETHGSKSQHFTYEEKYVWLAVHYLKGYLADYVTNDGLEGGPGFVKDYSKIVHVPNPLEGEKDDKWINPQVFSDWVQQEALLGEPPKNYEERHLEKEILKDPSLTIAHWIRFRETQFYLDTSDGPLTAIYNYINIHDSRDLLYARLEMYACIIKRSDLPGLVERIRDEEYDLQLTRHLEHLTASPDTDFYSNASDLVWMNWIGEVESAEAYFHNGKKKELKLALVKVSSTDSSGENQLLMPSKFLRDIMGITRMDGRFLYSSDKVASFIHRKKLDKGNYQDIVVVDSKLLSNVLKDRKLEMVWFTHVFKSSNTVSGRRYKHLQKSRKYITYLNKSELVTEKFWDEWYSSDRDKYSQSRLEQLKPHLETFSQIPESDQKQVLSLIISAGEVREDTLLERIKNAHLVAYFKDGETVLATASIKVPLDSYKEYVFSQSKRGLSAKEFNYELGYVVVRHNYRGHQLGQRLCGVLSEGISGPIFATTRSDNVPMWLVLAKLGFKQTGNFFASKNGQSNLILYAKNHTE